MNEADKKQNNLFEVCTQRQTEWLPSSSNSELLEGAIALVTWQSKFNLFRNVPVFTIPLFITILDSAESEDEFEILG